MCTFPNVSLLSPDPPHQSVWCSVDVFTLINGGDDTDIDNNDNDDNENDDNE